MNYLGDISLKKLITLIKTEIKTNSGGSADRVTYDNTASGLAGANVQEAIDELASNVGESFDAVIGTTWTGDAAPYTQEIAVAGILEDDDPITDLVVSDDYTTSQLQLDEFAKIYKIKTAEGKIIAYANEKTTVSLPIQLVVARDKVMDTEVIDGVMLLDGSVGIEKLAESAKGLDMVKLWENANTTSTFVGDISADLTDYQFVIMVFKYDNTTVGTNGTLFSYLLRKGKALISFVASGEYSGTGINTRYLAIEDNKITVKDNYNKNANTSTAGTVNNKYLIPFEVYGIKGVK